MESIILTLLSTNCRMVICAEQRGIIYPLCGVLRWGYINIEHTDESKDVIDCYLSHEHHDHKKKEKKYVARGATNSHRFSDWAINTNTYSCSVLPD